MNKKKYLFVFLTIIYIFANAYIVLADDRISEKQEVMELVGELSDFEEDVDYSGNELVFHADSLEDAIAIADEYDAQLTGYAYGIGKLETDEDVSELSAYSAEDNELVALYPDVIYQIDSVTPEDEPGYAMSWHHDFLNTVTAWLKSDGEGVVVAVIDSGVDLDHPDLKANIISSGFNALNNEKTADDDHGHGTRVAGVIAAADNGIGVIGIAPKAKIYPVKATDSKGSGDTFALVAGIEAAIAQGVDVINISLGSNMYSPLEDRAIKKAVDKGIVVVCSAGNDASEVKNYPAALPSTLSVAALNKKGDDGYCFALYSNYGETVDVAAPGTNIYTTSWSKGGEVYTYDSGTSFSCPMVTGIAALIKASDSSYRNKARSSATIVMDLIKNSSDGRLYDIDGVNKGVSNHVKDGVRADVALWDAVYTGGIVAPVFYGYKTDGSSILSGDNNYLSIKSSTAGAKIYYTIDGDIPSETEGELYTGPIALELGGNHTIRAVAMYGSRYSGVSVFNRNFRADAQNIVLNDGLKLKVKAGKKTKLKVDLYPQYATDMAFVWISDNKSFTVDSKGILTVAKDVKPGDVAHITAANDNCVSGVLDVVCVEQTEDVALTDISSAGITMTMQETAGTTAQNVYKSFDILEHIAGYDGSEAYIFSSSKPSVVAAYSSGRLVARTPGSAKITVQKADGSGSKVAFKVKVIRPVTDINAVISDTGFIRLGDGLYDMLATDSTAFSLSHDGAWNVVKGTDVDYIPIAQGGKIKLEAYINDDLRWMQDGDKGELAPSNKKLKWSCDNTNTGIKLSGKKLSVASYVPVGTTFNIIVEAADGFGAKKEIPVRVYAAPGKLTLKEDEIVISYSAYYKKGMNYFPESVLVNNIDGVNIDKTYRGYMAKVSGGKFFRKLKSTNSVMNAVYQMAYYGKSVVNFTTRDGSKKKIAVKVDVEK